MALRGAYVRAFNATTGVWTGYTDVGAGGTYSLTLPRWRLSHSAIRIGVADSGGSLRIGGKVAARRAGSEERSHRGEV